MGSVDIQSLGCSGRRRKVDEAVPCIASTGHLITTQESYLAYKGEAFYLPREFVTNHLNVDLLAHLEPKVTDEVLVDPGLQFTHPENVLASIYFPNSTYLLYGLNTTYQRVVLASPPCGAPAGAEGSPEVPPWKGAGVGSV